MLVENLEGLYFFTAKIISGGEKMVNRAFQYYFDSEKWIENTEEIFINSDIEKLPLVIFAEYAWKNDLKIISWDNYQFSSFVAVVKISRNDFESGNRIIYNVPIRWRIFQDSVDGPINIAADIIRLKYHSWHNIFLKRYENYFINVSMKKKIFVTNRKESGIKLPKIVVDAAMETLRDSTKAIYGIKPTIITKFEGVEKICAYVERPFDINIILLKNFFADFGDFDRIFPYESTDNYKIICRLLEIKPPRSLRKAYAKNPYAIIWYMIFKQLGVKDINFMQKFFLLDECITVMPLDEFRFRVKSKEVIKMKYSVRWQAFEYFCKFMIKNKGEKFFMNWLYKFSAKENLTQNQIDTIQMFYKRENQISPELQEKLWKDGLTTHVHDMMSWEVRESLKYLKNVRLIFAPEILKYEAIINGYEFKLVRDTKTLYFVSLELENCVMSYHDRFLTQESIIVVVIKNKKYVACIEIQGKNSVVQALGVRNRQLEGELLFVFELWTAWKNLIDCSEHGLTMIVQGEILKNVIDYRDDYFTPIAQGENIEPYTDFGIFVGSLVLKTMGG